MKKFILKASFFLCISLLILIIPSYFIDPYNVFHWNNIRNNGIEPNKNFIKTMFILHNPEKYNGFLFGSSRVGTIHVENIEDMKIYNMTYSAGTPKEHYETIKTFIDNGIEISVIYIGVDSYSYTEDPVRHYTQHFRSPYNYLTNIFNFAGLYINPGMVLQSISTIKQGKKTSGFDEFYSYGWWADYNKVTNIDMTDAYPVLGDDYRLEETIKETSDIKDLCEKNNIRLVIFTNPMYEITYRESVEKFNYLEFIKKLSEITEFYNFSGLNDITTNPNYYLDSSHYNAYVGDMMLEAIIKGQADSVLYEQGFGWYVTKDNVDELIQIMRF